MLGGHLVALSLTIRGRENLECPLARISSRLARSLLNGSDESGIKSEALLCEGHQRKVAGESGAGESIPAAAQEASRPGCWQSRRTTRSPTAANSNAIEAPINPPPMMATSNVFTIDVSSNRKLWRSGRDVRFILLGFGRRGE